jgi:cytoskeletal protein CcmA (bactofilin family)
VRPLRAPLVALLATFALVACDADVVRVTVVTAGHLTLEGGAHDGTFVVLDGVLEVQAGARIVGSVIVIDGALVGEGEIDGDVVALAGRVRLGEGAVVTGDLRVAGDLDRHPDARVDGTVARGAAVPAELADAVRGERAGLAATLARIVALALGAALLARLSPRSARNVAHAAASHPLVALSLGLLVAFVALVLVVVMAFTVVLIPVSLIAVALAVATIVLGWFGIGTALGEAASRRAGRAWPVARSALFGTLAFAILLTLIERIPLVWGIVPIAISALGLGAVVLTGFGVRRFVPAVHDDA